MYILYACILQTKAIWDLREIWASMHVASCMPWVSLFAMHVATRAMSRWDHAGLDLSLRTYVLAWSSSMVCIYQSWSVTHYWSTPWHMALDEEKSNIALAHVHGSRCPCDCAKCYTSWLNSNKAARLWQPYHAQSMANLPYSVMFRYSLHLSGQFGFLFFRDGTSNLKSTVSI